jgi:hypothetical protein
MFKIAFSVIMVGFTMTGCAQRQLSHVTLFPELPAVRDANPSIRHVCGLQVPTKLLIEFKSDQVEIRDDTDSMQEVSITLGSKMILGVETELSIFSGEKRIEHRVSLRSPPSFGCGTSIFTGLQKTANSQGDLDVVYHITIFETDIPAQHEWMPKSGRYKILWEGDIKALVPKSKH